MKAFLKAGVLTEDGQHKDTHTGTPQGGILSPLILNIALSLLDERLHGPWKDDGEMGTAYRRARRRTQGRPTWRAIGYADDLVVLVHSTRDDVEACTKTSPAHSNPWGFGFHQQRPRPCM